MSGLLPASLPAFSSCPYLPVSGRTATKAYPRGSIGLRFAVQIRPRSTTVTGGACSSANDRPPAIDGFVDGGEDHEPNALTDAAGEVDPLADIGFRCCSY